MTILVGEIQSTFVQKRHILDGALIANEVVWWLKRKKSNRVLLKLDFQKAYDSMRWDFLNMILEMMGFGARWRKWMECCVTIASMSILLNGSPSKPFKLERGLTQGYPFSPFLFVMLAETLNGLLQRAKEMGIIRGVNVGRNKVDISHLQFANDMIIFSPTEDDNTQNIRRILDCFAVMFGLYINYRKSAIIPIYCDEDWP